MSGVPCTRLRQRACAVDGGLVCRAKAGAEVLFGVFSGPFPREGEFALAGETVGG